MNRLTVGGIVKFVEVKQAGTSVVAKITLESASLKRDGTYQRLTSYTSSFNDTVINQINSGVLTAGDAIVGEGYFRPSAYQDKNGTTKVDPGIVLTIVNNLSLITKLNIPATMQQPVAQQPMQQPVAQQPTNINPLWDINVGTTPQQPVTMQQPVAQQVGQQPIGGVTPTQNTPNNKVQPNNPNPFGGF